MAAVVVDANENRTLARGRILQGGGHLGGLPRVDARVVDPGRQHHRRVLRALHDMVHGTGCVQVLEPGFGLDAAELRNVRRAVGRRLDAQLIGDRDLVEHRREELRSAVDRAAHRDPARAAAARPEFRRRRVLLRDQPLRAVDEVGDRVDLLRVLSGEMPFLTVFAAAADVRVGEHAAALEKGHPAGGESGIGRDPVRTVRVEQGRVRPVELDVAAVHDRERDRRAVRRRHLHLVGGDRRIVDG